MTDAVQKTFTRTNHLVHSLSPTITQILEHHPKRVAWLIVNLGSTIGYIGFDQDISTTRAIPVHASGGIFTTNARDDAELPTLPAFGVSPGGTTPVYIIEVIAQ